MRGIEGPPEVRAGTAIRLGHERHPTGGQLRGCRLVAHR